MLDDDSPATLASFSNSWLAHDACARLKEEGLSAYVSEEGLGTTLNYMGLEIGGVKVLVRRGDLDRANAFLEAEANAAPMDWGDGDFADDDPPGATDGPTKDELSHRAWWAAWLGFIVPLLLHVVALSLLLTIRKMPGALSAEGRTRVARTWVVLGLGLVPYVAVIVAIALG